MGAGIAYQYDHHVLVDYYTLTEQLDEEGQWIMGDDDRYSFDWETSDWEHFKSQVATLFNATEISELDDGREQYLFAETDRLYIGIDYSGADGTRCIYLKPKSWERIRHENGYAFYREVEYNLNRDAQRGFNRLIKMYGNLIEYWTTAWTASKYGQQEDGTFVFYGRKT